MAYRYPDSHVFYRKLGRDFPRIVRGDGCYLYDENGKRYLDAVGGAYVANLGHSNPEIADALARQARSFGYLSGTAFTHGPVEELAAELAATLPGDLDKLYFLSSGSEAVEAALKLARQYWVESGKPGKHKIIALAPGYHGNTLLALSASAREHYKTMFREWLVDVHRVPASYPYRCRCRGQDPQCPVCSGAVLEDAIERLGSDTVAAFIAEPVGGSSTGASTPRPEYFHRIREICDRHRVLFIADEILCGAGRTGTWWSIEPYGVAPDIMTLGKGISGGYAPLSAVAAPERILDAIAGGSGDFLHAQTFSHHPVARSATSSGTSWSSVAPSSAWCCTSGWRRSRRCRTSVTCAVAGCSPASSSSRTRRPGRRSRAPRGSRRRSRTPRSRRGSPCGPTSVTPTASTATSCWSRRRSSSPKARSTKSWHCWRAPCRTR